MNLTRHDDDHPPVVLHPPYAFVIAVLAASLISAALPLNLLSVSALTFPVAGLSLLLILWSSWVMHKARTGIPTYQTTTAIVDGGPFAISRNPIYVGLIGLILALAFLRGDLWYWLAASGFARFLHWGVVLREEAYLTDKFGDDYLDYKSRVKRWLLF